LIRNIERLLTIVDDSSRENIVAIYLLERGKWTTDGIVNSSWQPRPETETDRCERSLIGFRVRNPSGNPVDAAVVGNIRSTTFPVVESKVTREINCCVSIESYIEQRLGSCKHRLNIDPRFGIFLIARIDSSNDERWGNK